MKINRWAVLVAIVLAASVLTGCANAGRDDDVYSSYARYMSSPVIVPTPLEPVGVTDVETGSELSGGDLSSPVIVPPLSDSGDSATEIDSQPSDGETGNTTPSESLGVLNANRYDPNSLANPYGAGSPYKADGLMNPYSQYGSPYSNTSWNNPYATEAPKLYDDQGNYHGKLSSNPYDPDSTSNPYGRYGSPYSPDSINDPYGAGSPYSTTPIYVVPSQP